MRFHSPRLVRATCTVAAGLMLGAAPALAQDAHAAYFLFALASSMNLTEQSTPVCDAAAAKQAQDAPQLKVLSTHSYRLSQSPAELQAQMDLYASDHQFTALTSWTGSGSLNRSYADPDAAGYQYRVNLFPDAAGSVLCIGVVSDGSAPEQ
ncbi:hypothetical protein [Deinococcus sonorensis]|uniref:Uncharacterized protein n=2 Tax=Deinococcus sonorensis TaxID=309891 RepID=A0AAU7UBM5_9DEIO